MKQRINAMLRFFCKRGMKAGKMRDAKRALDKVGILYKSGRLQEALAMLNKVDAPEAAKAKVIYRGKIRGELSRQQYLRTRLDMAVKQRATGRAQKPELGPLPPYNQELEKQTTPEDKKNAERAEYSGTEEAEEAFRSRCGSKF